MHAATGLADQAIGLAAETGALAAGLRANLLVVEGNVADDAPALARTRWVLRDATVVGVDGRLAAPGVAG